MDGRHRKNCECCPVSLLIVRSERLSWIQVLNCQNRFLNIILSCICKHRKNCECCPGTPPVRSNGETAVFTFCQKAESGPKIRFSPKKTLQKSQKTDILNNVGGKGNFSFAQLCPVVARTWLESKSELFVGLKNPDLAWKSLFLLFHMGPRFWTQGRW